MAVIIVYGGEFSRMLECLRRSYFDRRRLLVHTRRNNMKARPDQIYDAVISRMVREALEAREKEFAVRHGDDTDQELLDYLRRCAIRLDHTPWPREIVGGQLILQRFGSWDEAVRRAHLLPQNTRDSITHFHLYRREVDIQKKEYRRKKQLKKERAALRREKAASQEAAWKAASP